ncbi:MAG: 1-acyl-sn-glycerol-3-phosphate acyltransferase [Myxococcota bacterium]
MRRALARAWLRMMGWEPEGEAPTAERFVLIAAPHTSNWDLIYLLAFAELYGVRVSWMGKHQLFRPPLGALFRALGGIAIRRHERGDRVALMAEEFASRERFALVVPTEATRGWTPHWKSGFYHIARRAEVPIVMGFLDYQRRRGGFGPALLASGDVKRDMDQVRAFYTDKVGKYPEKFGPVQLREEEPAAPAAL